MKLENKDRYDLPENLSGHFLISDSNMADPNFYKTVVLIIEHNSEGAFGLVVNRRSSLRLRDALPDLAQQSAADTALYIGGPVQQEYLFVIHGEMPDQHISSDAKTEVVEQVTFEPAFSYIKPYFEDEFLGKIPADDHPAIHLYLGYSGWGAGQLEAEMKIGSWMIHPANKQIVFHADPQEGWNAALHQKGGIYKVFADSKPNPHLN